MSLTRGAAVTDTARVEKRVPRPKFWQTPFHTTANHLTLCRFVLLPPIYYLTVRAKDLHDNLIVLGLVLIAVATDALDGYFARTYNQVSEWGKILDPMVDKIGLLGMFVVLYFCREFPWWGIAAFFLRDALVTAGSLLVVRRVGTVFKSNWYGKAAVTAYAAAVALYILDHGIQFPAGIRVADLFLVAGILFGYTSLVFYVLRYVRER